MTSNINVFKTKIIVYKSEIYLYNHDFHILNKIIIKIFIESIEKKNCLAVTVSRTVK